MIGLGIDLCEIARIEKAIEKNAAFLTRYFTEAEREYIAARGRAGSQSAAAMFAAKEAFLKAVGTGLSAIPLSDISIEHDELGAPHYVLSGKADEKMRTLGAARAHLSVTHEAGMACAVAAVE